MKKIVMILGLVIGLFAATTRGAAYVAVALEGQYGCALGGICALAASQSLKMPVRTPERAEAWRHWRDQKPKALIKMAWDEVASLFTRENLKPLFGIALGAGIAARAVARGNWHAVSPDTDRLPPTPPPSRESSRSPSPDPSIVLPSGASSSHLARNRSTPALSAGISSSRDFASSSGFPGGGLGSAASRPSSTGRLPRPASDSSLLTAGLDTRWVEDAGQDLSLSYMPKGYHLGNPREVVAALRDWRAQLPSFE